MTIRGFFSTFHLVLGGPSSPTAIPYVQTMVELPAFDRVYEVRFLVDTGADFSILNPQDSEQLVPAGVWQSLPNPAIVGGAGAGQVHFPLVANVYFFQEGGTLLRIETVLHAAPPNSLTGGNESLLGRDLLANFVMTFDQAGRALTLEQPR